MHRIFEKLSFLKDIQAPLMGLVSIVAAYFDSTFTFMIALFAAFIFNILAGLRADDVTFKMWRIINFDGHKFKDSLKELVWMVFSLDTCMGSLPLSPQAISKGKQSKISNSLFIIR